MEITLPVVIKKYVLALFFLNPWQQRKRGISRLHRCEIVRIVITVANAIQKVFKVPWTIFLTSDTVVYNSTLMGRWETEFVLNKWAGLSVFYSYDLFQCSFYRSHDPCKLINVIPLDAGDENSNYHCIQIDKLTPELSVFWFTLIEFFQSDKSKCEYLEAILPDLTTYCDYVVR